MRFEHERRGLPRETGSHAVGLRSLRFRAGAPVDVVDVSPVGALIETDRYLGPGTIVEMLLSRGRGTVPLRVRVAHARVCRLSSGCRPRYRVGVCFLADPAAEAAPRVAATHAGTTPDGQEPHYPPGTSAAAGAPSLRRAYHPSERVARALEGSAS